MRHLRTSSRATLAGGAAAGSSIGDQSSQLRRPHSVNALISTSTMSPPAGLSSCRKLYVWAPSVTPDTVLDWASNCGHVRVESAKVVNSRRVNIESLRLALSAGAFVSQI